MPELPGVADPGLVAPKDCWPAVFKDKGTGTGRVRARSGRLGSLAGETSPVATFLEDWAVTGADLEGLPSAVESDALAEGGVAADKSSSGVLETSEVPAGRVNLGLPPCVCGSWPRVTARGAFPSTGGAGVSSEAPLSVLRLGRCNAASSGFSHNPCPSITSEANSCSSLKDAVEVSVLLI